MPESDPPTRERPRLVNERGEPVRRRKRRSFLFRLIRGLIVLGLIITPIAGAGLLWFLHNEARTPREWAPYLERRADQHNPIIVGGTALVANYLMGADRMERGAEIKPPPHVGASASRSGPIVGAVRPVTSQAELRSAVANARPGEVILLMPGRHVFVDRQISITRSGLPQAPITIRATRLGDAIIEANQEVVLKIQAPYWHVENLVIRGTCRNDRYCEHAFHVTGDARGTIIRNNLVEDLNAAVKINGEKNEFPDDGRLDGNTFVLSRPRDTQNPITPIDLVAANNWRISGNFIADFLRADASKPTYGAFVKGAGERNIVERNVVFCEWKLRGRGQRVGLSLGGGGTMVEAMRDKARSGFEQIGGVIRDNLIAFCSDVGIYVNKSNRSIIEHNTLIDTAGIDIRFPESSADITANVVDGAIRPRDGALIRARGNEIGPLLGLFLGYHPVRTLYRDVGTFDLAWKEKPTAPGIAGNRTDLCGVPRPEVSVAGAFEDWSKCR